MGSLGFLLYILGFFLIIYLIIYLNLVKTLLGIRLKNADCQLGQLSELPYFFLNLFNIFDVNLRNLGFSLSHCQLADEPIVTAHSKKWNLVYVNDSKESYANVSLPAMPDKDVPFKIEFSSFFSDGHQLLTTNGNAHDIIGKIPDVTLCDEYVVTLEKQFEVHLKYLSQLKQKHFPIKVVPAEYVEKEKAGLNNYIANLETKGLIKKHKEFGYQIRIFAALKHAFKAIFGNLKMKNMRSNIKKYMKAQKLKPVDIPIEAEVNAFLRMRELMQSKNKGYIGTIAVCLISLVISMVFFKMALDIRTAFIIILVLGFHELGHYIAMRMFGHKDVHILFLPFGAATIAADEDKATPMQRIIIYFLGPVPGLILGACLFCMAQIYDAAFMRDLGLFLLILNYLNLLPILPLDGGRVVEIAVFSRWKVLKVLFLGFSAFLLGLAGIFSADKILLIIAVALAAGIVPQIRKSMLLTKLMNNIREKGLPHNDEAVSSQIFALMKEGSFSKMSFNQKFQTAKALLPEIYRKPATIGVSIFAMFLYAAAFLMPLVVAVVWAISIGLLGGGTDYTKGIRSFTVSNGGEYVFVTRQKNLLSHKGVVLDKNGQLVLDLKKNIGYTNPNLVWRLCDGNYWLAYKDRHLRSADNGANDLILHNINTNDEKIVRYPRPDPNFFIEYFSWSSDGHYLFGTETPVSEEEPGINSVFRIDVISGDIQKAKTAKPGNPRYVQKFLTDINSAVLSREVDEDSNENAFSLLNMITSEENRFELGNEVGQWEILSNTGKLIYLEKIFKDNMVNHQLVCRNLKTSRQNLLIPPEVLPKYSFEDAAKDKKIYLSFNLSPKGKWAVCSSRHSNQNCVSWLVNLENGNYNNFLKYDEKEHYINILFSATETRLCAVYSNTAEFTKDVPPKTLIEFYDIEKTKMEKISYLEIERQAHSFNFLGDECLLYIKGGTHDSPWKNSDELYAINISDGTQKPFIGPKSLK